MYWLLVVIALVLTAVVVSTMVANCLLILGVNKCINAMVGC